MTAPVLAQEPLQTILANQGIEPLSQAEKTKIKAADRLNAFTLVMLEARDPSKRTIERYGKLKFETRDVA